MNLGKSFIWTIMFPNQAEIQRKHLNGLFIHSYQPSKAKFLTQKD